MRVQKLMCKVNLCGASETSFPVSNLQVCARNKRSLGCKSAGCARAQINECAMEREVKIKFSSVLETN